jgi:hypothetical protein
LKLGHVPADRLDAPGYICAPNPRLRRAEPEAHDAYHVWQAGHEMPHTRINAGRVNAYQHLIVFDHRLFDVREFQDIR